MPWPLMPSTRPGERRARDDFTAPFSLTGQSTVVVRGGQTLDDRPLGVQVVARLWREDVALAVAHSLEEEPRDSVRPRELAAVAEDSV